MFYITRLNTSRNGPQTDPLPIMYGIYLFLFAVIVGCSTDTSRVELPSTIPTELDPILNTLQARYDLTGSLKITQMVVTVQEGKQPSDRYNIPEDVRSAFTPESSEELRELLWYKKSENGGDLLHIQALGPINESRGVAIANQDKNQFVLSLLNEQKTYRGPLSDGALREIFGMDLRVSDVLSAIFANPFLDGRTTKFTSVEQAGAKFTITRPGVQEGHVETVILFVRDGEPRVTEWRIHNKENDGLLQHAVFSDYREVSGILRPHKVEIERPLEQTRISVNIAKVQLNVEISDSKFDAAPFLSDDFEIIRLSELAE